MAIHTVGESWRAVGGFEVSLALTPERTTRQRLGVFGLGAGLAEAVGPGLLIWLYITWGQPGGYVVGTLFLMTGLAMRTSSDGLAVSKREPTTR